VVAAPNQTKFAHADGTPFFSVATTVYGMFINAPVTLKTLETSPFNKVRTLMGVVNQSVYQNVDAHNMSSPVDPTRFNPKGYCYIESVLDSMAAIGVHAELILFMNDFPYPRGQGCLGGSDLRNYNTTLDELYIKYTVARLASFRNVWFSMANEWNQLSCYWAPPPTPPGASLCPNGQRDVSDPGCGFGGSNLPAWDTPIWDRLFQTVHEEDPSDHLLSIHNNAFLYNYSRPWVSHFSLQHTHNKPRDLWEIYGLKPFQYDEVKYEGRLGSNWGSLSAPQMAQRFWWIASAGAYGMHGEMLYKCPYWSDNSGVYCGQSVEKIAWFKDYMENTTLHPPFEECVGDDDGYVHTLSCGTEVNTSFVMFHFYNGHPNASSTFQYVYLPKDMKSRQDLMQPWEMIVTLIWKPPTRETSGVDTDKLVRGSPPPPRSHIFGPKRKGWEPVGITVDEDTLPHILTFTACDYKNACERSDFDPPELRYKGLSAALVDPRIESQQQHLRGMQLKLDDDVPPECSDQTAFLSRYHFIGKPSQVPRGAPAQPKRGAGYFPDSANDANALFYHKGYLHAMHQTATLWSDLAPKQPDASPEAALHCAPPAKPCKDHPTRCCRDGPPAPCPARPCPGHKGRTFCPNVKASDQCDKVPAPCPPGLCHPPPPAAPPPRDAHAGGSFEHFSHLISRDRALATAQ
jgi:hypothetical protein